MIKRHIFDSIINDFFKGKVIIIYGARQVGKTTLINQILKKFGTDSIYVNCDEPYYARELSNKSSAELNMIFEDKKPWNNKSGNNGKQPQYIKCHQTVIYK